MVKLWKVIIIIIVFCTVFLFPVYAMEREDEIVFGEGGRFGSVYGEEYINETGDTANWLTLQLGERGIRIINEEKRELIIVDKYGGIYLNGEVYVNGERYGEDKGNKGVFYPEGGFLYVMIIISLGTSIFSLKKRGIKERIERKKS